MESVAGVVFSADRTRVLLILRRDVPVWVLPGGGIDPGESPEQAIVREILEETGFQVKIDSLVGHYYPINRLAKKTALFTCSIIGGSAALSDETGGIQFFPFGSLPAMPPPYPEWICDSMQTDLPFQKELTSVNYLRLLGYLFTHPVLVIRFLFARLGLPLNSGRNGMDDR